MLTKAGLLFKYCKNSIIVKYLIHAIHSCDANYAENSSYSSLQCHMILQ